MKLLTALLCLVMFTSCASSAKRLQRVSIGMSKAQVIDQLGDAGGFKAMGNTEVLEYHMSPDSFVVRPYWVVFQDGKVTSYGAAGDFGTMQAPTQKLIIETSAK